MALQQCNDLLQLHFHTVLSSFEFSDSWHLSEIENCFPEERWFIHEYAKTIHGILSLSRETRQHSSRMNTAHLETIHVLQFQLPPPDVAPGWWEVPRWIRLNRSLMITTRCHLHGDLGSQVWCVLGGTLLCDLSHDELYVTYHRPQTEWRIDRHLWKHYLRLREVMNDFLERKNSLWVYEQAFFLSKQNDFSPSHTSKSCVRLVTPLRAFLGAPFTRGVYRRDCVNIFQM